MSSISNVCSNAGKAVEKLSRLEVVGMQEGNARKRKQEREAECKQKRRTRDFPVEPIGSAPHSSEQ